MRPAPLLVRLNALFKAHFVAALLVGVATGVAFPAMGVWLKDLAFFQLPGTRWEYDFPNLALGLMMLSAILGCEVRDFRKVLQQPRPALLTLAVIYGVIPALAAATGLVWMRTSGGGDVQVLVGLMLSALMPVAMTSSVWVRLSAGNVPLLLSLITVTTALSVVSVPVYLRALLGVSGTDVGVPTDQIVQQLVVSVTFPLVLGLGLRQLFPRAVARAQDTVTFLGNVALWLVVVANVAVAAPHVVTDGRGFFAAVALAVGLNVVSFAVGLLAARAIRLSHEDALTLLFGSGMRSNSTGLMLGLKSFPDMPLVAVPAAVYMISQHLFAAFLARKLERPGSRLLGTTVATERRSLEAYLDRALPAPSTPALALLVFRLRHADELPGRARERLMRLIRRCVRQSDFVCLLGEDSFGLVLVDARANGVPLVLDRVARTTRAFEPGLELTHGAVHCSDGRPSTTQFIEQALRIARGEAQLPQSLPGRAPSIAHWSLSGRWRLPELRLAEAGLPAAARARGPRTRRRPR